MLTTPVETLKLLLDTGKATGERKLVPLPNNPEMHLLISPDKVETIPTPYAEQPRRHTVLSIDDFAEAYAWWYLDSNDIGRVIGDAPDGEGDAKTLTDQIRAPNIWCDIEQWALVFFVDEPLRRSWVKLQLKSSPQHGTVFKFAKATVLEQKDLVRMLRHDLMGCVPAPVLQAFRSVDFQKIENARRNIQHDRQSLDADLVTQVIGEKKPEEFIVEFPMLATRELDFKSRVLITVDIDADNKRFVLQAAPNELELAVEQLRYQIIDRLETELGKRGLSDVTILCGTPGGPRTPEL